MGLLRRGDEHAWSQAHLSHYVDGDLSRRARLRLQLHAEECPDCSRGILALRALLRLMHGVGARPSESAPSGIFDRVRADARQTARDADQALEG